MEATATNRGIPKNKLRVVAFLTFTLLCVIGLGASYIADYANNEIVTWSSIVMCAVPMAWVTFLPLFLAKGKRIWLSLLALSVAVIPFLYFLDRAIDAKSWFNPIGLPVAITSIVVMWISVLLFKLVKVNKFYLAAGITAAGGFAILHIIFRSLNSFLDAPLSSWANMIGIFTLAVAAVIILIVGYVFDK